MVSPDTGEVLTMAPRGGKMWVKRLTVEFTEVPMAEPPEMLSPLRLEGLRIS